MALLFTQASDGQRIDMPAGLHVGHPLVTRDGCHFAGAGADRTIIRLDGTYGTGFQAGAVLGEVTVSDCTIDCDLRAGITTAFNAQAAGFSKVILRRVRVINMHWIGTAVLDSSELDVETLWTEGSGGGVQVHTGATLARLRSVDVVGGKFGLVVSDSDDPGSIPGLDVNGLTIDLLCSQSPTFEVATATAVSPTGIACSHVLAHRSPNDLVRVLVPVCDYDPDRTLRDQRASVGDRIECGNAWTRITGISGTDRQLDPWREHESMRRVDPSGPAVVYRCFYGGVLGYQEGLVILRNGWRTAAGEEMGTPLLSAGHRVDIVRHGITGGPRDYDTGAVHVTKSALSPVIRRVSVRDGGSDLVSVRGPGGILSHCHASIGRDYAITVTAHHGAQTVEHCQAEDSGVGGFYLGGGASVLTSCRADRNGWNGGGYGFAFHQQPGNPDHDTGSTVSGTGADNHTALSNRPESIAAMPRRTRRVPVRWWGMR